MRIGRGAATAVFVAALVAALAGCGDAENNYVANERAGVFLKLPTDWETFEVLGRDPTVRDSPVLDSSGGRWKVVFDSSANPSRFHIEEPEPDAPVGFVSVTPGALVANPADPGRNPIPLDDSAVLRSSLFDFAADPFDAERFADQVQVEPLDYDEVDLDGFWGNRLTARLTNAAGTQIVVTNLSFTDDGGEKLYQLYIFCSVDCYERYEDDIEDVVDTFTLEG